MSENSFENKKNSLSDLELKKLLELLNSISFGSVTLVIQDGKIVQMEKNEKLRIK